MSSVFNCSPESVRERKSEGAKLAKRAGHWLLSLYRSAWRMHSSHQTIRNHPTSLCFLLETVAMCLHSIQGTCELVFHLDSIIQVEVRKLLLSPDDGHRKEAVYRPLNLSISVGVPVTPEVQESWDYSIRITATHFYEFLPGTVGKGSRSMCRISEGEAVRVHYLRLGKAL